MHFTVKLKDQFGNLLFEIETPLLQATHIATIEVDSKDENYIFESSRANYRQTSNS